MKITPKNLVYLGCSLDGYIAGPKGELDWLECIPNPDGIDMGYKSFMDQIDALVMGRNSFEKVASFDQWPYDKPVYVWSHKLKSIPSLLESKAFLVTGSTPRDVLSDIHSKGHTSLYIDGGQTVNSFLKEDLIDELTITTLPIVLGDGIPLFRKLPQQIPFELVDSTVYLGHVVQSHYRRAKK